VEVKEIIVSKQTRVNTGNYEGTEVLVSMRAELGLLDDASEEVAALGEQVDAALNAQLMRLYGARRKKATPANIALKHGIPVD
jgi:predicted site-specific integrase-resolvase